MFLISGTMINVDKLKDCCHQFNGENYSDKQTKTYLSTFETLSRFENSKKFWKNFNFTFVSIVPYEVFHFFLETLTVSMVPQGERALVLVSGTMDQFFLLFQQYMIRDQDKTVLRYLNLMFDQLERIGVVRLFNQKVTDKVDGVFYLK